MASTDVSPPSITPTQVSGATDGVLQISKSTGANPTTLTSGIVVGPATAAGVSLVYDSTTSGNAGWRAMTGNMAANAGMNAIAFSALAVANVNFGVNVGVASQTGMGMPTLTSIGWYVSNTQYGLLDSNGNWSNMKRLAQTKATNYTVTTADNGTHITVTAAATLTLMPSVAGSIVHVTNLNATALTVTAQTGNIFALGLTAAASRSTSTAVATAEFYYDGTQWIMRCFNGTWA